jgi:hypothetical protein
MKCTKYVNALYRWTQSPLDLLMLDMAETKKTKKEILDYDWKKENYG